MRTLQTTEAFGEAVEALVEQTRQGGKPRISEPDDVLRTTVVQALGTQIPRAVVVQVPAALDQIERVASDIGAQLGPSIAAAVDDRLHTRPDTITELLAQCLEDRPLIVDGRDRVGDLGGGTDLILKAALREQLEHFERFIDRSASCVAVSSNPKQAFARGRAPFTTEALGDATAVWEHLGCKTEGFQLCLSLAILRGEAVEDEAQLPAFLPEADTLRDQIQTELSDPERALLDILCAHARPLPKAILARRTLGDAVDFGHGLRLWHADRSSVWVTRGWSRWWERTRPEQSRCVWYRDLASSFHDEANRGPDEHRGSNLLEALRHYTNAGDDEQAKRCARYGVQSLVGRARDLSRRHEYGRAASLYGFVAERAEESPQALPISAQLHAYSIHYMWWNRNRESKRGTPLAQTIDGYRKAVDLWPQNAYFWSRLIRAYFYDDEPQRALLALEEGLRKVPEHREKHSVLIGRTVDGLIKPEKSNKYRFAAALVWAAHEPGNHLEQSTFSKLTTLLAEGWETAWLRIPNGPELAFQRLVRVQLEFVASKALWLAELAELRETAAGETPREALTQLVETLRETTRRLLKGFTHRLTASERLRKQIYFSTIDIVASGLQAEIPSQVWVIGELVEGHEGVMFCVDDDLLHPLAAELGSVPFDKHPRLARFATDGVGRPTGPAIELSEPFRGDASELWAALRARRTSG